MGFFHEEDAARAAVDVLKANQFEEVQLEDFSPYPGQNASDLDNPISEPIGSLASEVLEADTEGPDEQRLLATMPDASGMADGERHHSAENWLVTVVAPYERHEQAKQLLQKQGARF